MASSLAAAPPSPPFDAVAAGYDAAFTEQRLGRWLRGMVWQRLAAAFAPGERVLELGCGTGEDAFWLARRGCFVTATDASGEMLVLTRRKADAAGVGDVVATQQLDMESLGSLTTLTQGDTLSRPFDGVLSNFGPLNCVADRGTLARGLAGLVRPGGRVVLVVMGPVCPWEIVWFLGKRKPRSAFRRFHAGREARVGDSSMRVWYPSPRRLQREFAPYFKAVEVAGIGLLLPPSAMGRLVERAPRPFSWLAAIDRRLAGTLPWRWLNDHYLLILERR